MNCLKCLLPLNEELTSHYGLHFECFCNWFNLNQAAEFSNLQQRSGLSFEEPQAASRENTSFFHGKFKKYSTDLLGTSYIFKKREANEAPELPEVEYLCNQIGKFLDVPVAEFYLIDFFEDKTFVTKNFIKSSPITPTDLQHIYHFVTDKKHSCEQLIEIITKQTKRPHDVDVFIQTILYDALIGNHDRHGRNLAFIVTPNKTLLSPIYDNVSYLALESDWLEADFDPTGKIITKDNTNPSMKDYVKELTRLGYKEQVMQFYRKIKTPLLEELVANSFCSEPMKKALLRLILKRTKELESELEN